MLVLVSALATASAGVEMTREGNVIRGTVEVDVASADLVRLVQDPIRVGRASGSDMEYTPLGARDGCAQMQMWIPTFLGKIGGDVRACDTPTGSVVVMTKSKQFTTYRYSWAVLPLGDARSRLTYEIEMDSSLPVPQRFMWNSTTKGVQSALTKLQEWRPR